MKKVLKRFLKGDSHSLDDETVQTILRDKDVIVSPDTQREIRIPPGQHEDNSWPVLHAGQVAKIVPEKWELEIGGLVDEEVKLNYQEFMDLPRVQVFSDIHCVTSWSKLNNLWEGVSTSTIKELVGIRPEAKYVLVHAHKNFTTNLSLEDFFCPGCFTGHPPQWKCLKLSPWRAGAPGCPPPVLLEKCQMGNWTGIFG